MFFLMFSHTKRLLENLQQQFIFDVFIFVSKGIWKQVRDPSRCLSPLQGSLSSNWWSLHLLGNLPFERSLFILHSKASKVRFLSGRVWISNSEVSAGNSVCLQFSWTEWHTQLQDLKRKVKHQSYTDNTANCNQQEWICPSQGRVEYLSQEALS